jgi:hypothetical protein
MSLVFSLPDQGFFFFQFCDIARLVIIHTKDLAKMAIIHKKI